VAADAICNALLIAALYERPFTFEEAVSLMQGSAETMAYKQQTLLRLSCLIRKAHLKAKIRKIIELQPKKRPAQVS